VAVQILTQSLMIGKNVRGVELDTFSYSKHLLFSTENFGNTLNGLFNVSTAVEG
jgi:hypothetical protein